MNAWALWREEQQARLPLSDAQVRAHFDAAFVAQVSPAVLNQTLEAVVSVKLLSIQVSELSTLVAVVSTGGAVQQAQVWLTVDGRGLISGLRISPASTGSTLATWAGVDAALRSVAPQVRLVGRSAVEAALTATGMASPTLDRPFLDHATRH